MKLRGRGDVATSENGGPEGSEAPDRIVIGADDLARLSSVEGSSEAPVSFLDADPDIPEADLPRRSAFYVVRRAFREFGEDDGRDMAAALTYWGVLAMFPALLALASILGLVGEGDRAVNFVLDVIRPVVHGSATDRIAPTLRALSHSDAAGWTFAIGLAGALWAASGYVAAFGRAMNRIYEVREGRPLWRLIPLNLFVTVLTLVLAAGGVLIIGVSGPIARSVGDRLNIGHTTVEVWDIAKWPVLALIVVVMIALLYYMTPNIKRGKVRVLSIGAAFAIVVWLVATVALGVYVANVHNYDRVYGSLAGAVVFLLWLYLTNAALLLGAELDSELERARQLHRGVAAEEHLQMVTRSVRRLETTAARKAKDIAAGRGIREARIGAGDPEDRPF